MSCQQASRFITTTTAAAATVTATTAKSTAAATKRIATQQSLATAAATTTATTNTVGAKLAAKTTPTVTLLDGESVGVVAAGKTNTPEDPYVFTETVAATPPILFNAQKSRARLNEAQHNSRNNNNNGSNRQTVAGKKSSIVGATAASIAQLNGTATATTTTASTARATAATAAATAKAQASLAATTAAAAAATTTTNFNNVTQSQRQPTSQSQLQLQLQSTLQLQPQASPKRATNVCVVRPQQQQQQQMQQQQQQQQLKQQQAKLSTKHHAPHPPPPPPLYTHTPSLWQTPLLLDTTQQQKQQPQQQTNLVVATALVSPPISPASLPSPTANAAPPTAAVTAMVSPIVLPPAAAVVAAAAAAGAMSPPKGASLPPSKFHHTTLAQHLQKVECLKKKKSLPLACQNSNNINNNNNNNIIVETLQKRQTFGGYNLTHPPPLTAFNSNSAATTTTIATPTVVGEKKHCAEAVDDNSSDLNEIPVNVIFRKPPGPVLLPGPATQQTPPRPGAATDAKMKLGAVTPLTPPTPPSPANASAMSAPLLLPSLGGVTVAAAAAQPAPPPATTAAAAAVQNEQMSSKVANSVPKRRAPAANAGCRKGNKTSVKQPATELPLSLSQTLPLVAVQQPEELQPPAEPASRRRKQPATANKRQAVGLISENEPLPLDDVPYCLQTRWLHDGSGKDLALDATQSVHQQGNRDREERIAVRKGLLRRQALQLLSTRPLQELPMRAARQRLQGIQTLLVKYQDHANQQQGIGIGNRCLVNGCKQPTLSMAAHCESHIVNNSTQKLFQPCVAWRVNGSACQAPVFDMLHTLALCSAHSHLRPGLEQQSRQQLPQQPKADKALVQQLTRPPPTPAVPGPAPAYALTAAAATAAAATAGKRKRKTNPNANPVGRPLKRAKKQPDTTTTAAGAVTTANNAPATLPTVMSMTTLPPMSAVMQRKSSTTSLESIASNSQSSAKSHSALQPYTPTAPVLTMPQLSIIPPALAPLSDYQLQQQQQQLAKLEPEQQQQQLDANMLANANFKADEISQIVAQLAAAGNELHHNNNNNNNNLHYNNNMSYCSNNNSNSGSSSISCGFPSFNAAFGNAMGTGAGQGHQHQQQQLVTSLHANTSLASTESLLSQQIFGICENSSAYASSEDTGLGGLSESELIGANDADDIALNGAHLLEEHDLVNVFDTLPEDAFNELFQSVQQDECEAMDRALEIADKNLKCLQQTIGGTAHDSAFLNDFLDVGDDLLVNAVMNSPNTSGIDTSTLFVDSSGSGSGISSTNGPVGSSSAASVADIRGLVHI